jgi:hypothetical protein
MVGSNISSGLGRSALCETLESRSHLSATVGTDASFNGGRFFTKFYGINEEATDVVTLKDGRVLVGGRADDAQANAHLVFALYNKNGSLSTSFDGDGKLILSTAASRSVGEIRDVSLLKDGNVLVVGTNKLLKLKTSGQIDTAFGASGYATLPAPNYNSRTLVLSDGTIRYGSYDAETGVLRSAKYSAAGQSTQSLRRTINKDGGGVLITPTAAVLSFNDGTARQYRVDLSIESKFGKGGTLDLKPAYTAFAKANGPWTLGDQTYAVPEINYGGFGPSLTKTGYAFTATTDAFSDKVKATYGKYEGFTYLFAYAAPTGTSVTAGGGDVDGTRFTSTRFQAYPQSGGDAYFGGWFTTTSGQRTYFEAEGFGGSELATVHGFTPAGNGQYYVVGGSFLPGDVDNNYYGFIVGKTAFIG